MCLKFEACHGRAEGADRCRPEGLHYDCGLYSMGRSTSLQIRQTRCSADLQVCQVRRSADLQVCQTRCSADLRVRQARCSADLQVCQTRCSADLQVCLSYAVKSAFVS